MQFQEVVILEKSLAVDEQMIPFKGPNSLKKYLSEKPEKWGKWFCCSSPNRSLRVKYPQIALCLPDVVKFLASKGVWALATLKPNRSGKCPLPPKKD